VFSRRKISRLPVLDLHHRRLGSTTSLSPLGPNNTLVFAPGPAAGFSNADDRLPECFEYEPVPPHNVVWDFTGEEFDKFWDF